MKISTCTIVALVSLSASVIVDARVGRVKSGIRGTVGRILKEDKEKRYDDDDAQETKEVAEAAEADLPLTEVVGNNGVFDTFPLLLCQGECDNDDEVSKICGKEQCTQLCLALYFVHECGLTDTCCGIISASMTD